MTGIDAWPLLWPPGWPRTRYRELSRFKTSLVDARDGLLRELVLLGATSIVLSTNAVLNRNGSISARQPRIDDPGVAAYFFLNGEQRCIPADKWTRIEDNLHAIELTVAALRGLERWGAKEIVAAAFQGFQALPEGTSAAWWRVLETEPTASEVEIESAYRRLAKAHHPDVGGDAARFAQIADAYRQAKERRTA